MSFILNQSMETFEYLSESNEEPYERLSAYVKSFYEHMKYSNQFPTKPLEPMKSSALSLKFRNEGNAAYCQKNDSKAIVFYTRSISVALPDSEELAIAFANRSAVLFRRKDYVHCFVDIKRALNGKYPESMRPKLAIRKKRCIQKIEKQNDRNKLWLVSSTAMYFHFKFSNRNYLCFLVNRRPDILNQILLFDYRKTVIQNLLKIRANS